MKILVVDDSEISLKLLEASFKKAGFEVFTAIDGYEAVTISKTHRIDIIVSDLNMPYMSGYEFAKIIRRTDSEITIMLYTSKSSSAKDMIELAKKHGINFIENSNLETILFEVLSKFEVAIKKNMASHNSI